MAGHYYINNEDLLKAIEQFKATCQFDENGKYVKGSGRIGDELGVMLLKIVRGLSMKSNFSGYTFKEDMIGDAILTIVKYLHNFNADKCPHAFNYVTQIAYRSFQNTIKKFKRISKMKNCIFERQHMIIEESCGSIDYSLYASKEEII